MDNPLGIIARQGDKSDLILQVKRRLGFAYVDDVFDVTLEQRLRGIQMIRGFQTHGQLDEKTLAVIGVRYEPPRSQ